MTRFKIIIIHGSKNHCRHNTCDEKEKKILSTDICILCLLFFSPLKSPNQKHTQKKTTTKNKTKRQPV